MGQKSFVELLSPAGSKEAFYGAIHAGADAVYLGGNRFSARAYADNFSTEELVECIRYAHLWGKKVYLTVNTLVKEAEFLEVCDSVKPCYEAGLDGVIVQDIGVFVSLRRHFPNLELHASTQMTLTGVPGAALLKSMGACRIVPARELGLEEIRDIKNKTGLEIETFIHGAMCYCYSGKCLFSSMLGGRSGNRGRCAQPCRLPYQIDTTKERTGECFPLSLKDMCTIQHIPKLIEAGIDSFKIEGRMKKPEYVAGVTAIYRKYIDLYYRCLKDGQKDNQAEWKIDKKDLRTLESLYIRSGTQDGYYFKHNGREMITLGSPAYCANDEELLQAIRGRYLEKRPSMPILIRGSFLTGMPAQLTLTLERESKDSLIVTVTGDEVQKAKNQPITAEDIKRRLGKLGNSIFEAKSMEITADKDVFYPVGAINELRREAVKKLEDLLIAANGMSAGRKAEEPAFSMETFSTETFFGKTVRVPNEERKRYNDLPHGNGSFVFALHTVEQLEAVLAFADKASLKQEKLPISRIYIEGDMLFTEEQNTLDMCSRLKGSMRDSLEIILSLPHIIRKRDSAYVEKLSAVFSQNKDIFDGIQVKSIDGMGLWEQFPGRIYGDAGLYIWNRETLKAWKPFLSGFCMPLELTSREQRCLIWENGPSCEKIIYGRIPMMITANCVAKTASQCGSDGHKEQNNIKLIDRYRKTFPVELNCLHCINIIYNSVPLSLHGELENWKDKVSFRLDFTIEDRRETTEILDFYKRIRQADFAKNIENPPFSEYTTGHEKHGTE